MPSSLPGDQPIAPQPARSSHLSSAVDRPSARDLFLLTVFAGILFFIALGERDLWNPNEPIYGRATAEMAAGDDWLKPTVNGQVFAEKPILYYWGARIAAVVMGGVDETSLRLPSALAGTLAVLLTYLWIVPYAGRRRALIAGLALMTLYQVFWAARAVQMDILVLASTLGVVVPLCHWLDFDRAPRRAFALAGIAAGLGFLAKGPVALVLPAIVVVGYAAVSGRLAILFHRRVWPSWLLGGLIAGVIAAPWFVLLAIHGDWAFLNEVLLRQNFNRFVQAWDHDQPWWYFLEYLWVDYAPWAWLLPAAALCRWRDRLGQLEHGQLEQNQLTENQADGERQVELTSWLWIVGVIFFFSLSDSKRAPYILPIAPAVACLAAGVIDRWVAGTLSGLTRVAAAIPFGLFAIIFTAGGGLLLSDQLEIPDAVVGLAAGLGWILLALGLLQLAMLLWPRRGRGWHAPASLFGAMVVLCLTAAVWVLPAFNAVKSARGFSQAMNQRLNETGGSVASFGFWDWRSSYYYYADRIIPNVDDQAELEAYWAADPMAHVLVEDCTKHDCAYSEALEVLGPVEFVSVMRVGSRTAALLAHPANPSRRLSQQAVPDDSAGVTSVDLATNPRGESSASGANAVLSLAGGAGDADN